MFRTAGRGTTAIAQILLTVFALIFALPLVVMFGVSLMGRGWGNYEMVFAIPDVLRFVVNSLLITLCTVFLVYTISTLAAFAFAKLRFPLRSALFNALLIGLMIPGVAVTVPLFNFFRMIGLLNNPVPVVLTITAFTLPLALLLTRNFLDGVPDELLQAAYIDGCTTFTALLYVIVPLARPIGIVVFIWSFLAAWNDYFTSLVYIRSDALLPLTHLPNFFVRKQTLANPDIAPIFAALVLMSIPVMIAYILLQRYFEQGIVSGALK